MTKITDSVDPGNIQTIGELWDSIAQFCNSRIKDNSRYNGEYPLETRINQMAQLKGLVNAIEEFHKFAENKEK